MSRRNWIPFAGLVVLVAGVEALLLAFRHAPEFGETMYLVRQGAAALLLAGPLLTAFAGAETAYQVTLASRGHGPGLPWRRFLKTWGWYAGAVLVIHLVALTVSLCLGGDWSPRGGWGHIVLALLAQVAMVIWCGCLGSYIGRYATAGVATGLGLVGTGVLLMLLSTDGVYQTGFSPILLGADDESQIGLQFGTAGSLLRIGLLAVTGVLLMLAPGKWVESGAPPDAAPPGPPPFSLLPRRDTWHLVAWLETGRGGKLMGCSALAVIAAAALMAPDGLDIKENQTGPDVCTDAGGVEYCYYREHQRFAAPIQAELAGWVAEYRAAGYGQIIPQRVDEQAVRGSAQQAGPGTGTVLAFDDASLLDNRFFWAIQQPTWCPGYQVTTDSDAESLAGLSGPALDIYKTFQWTLTGTLPEDSDPNGFEPLTVDQIKAIQDGWAACAT
ncbi:MAG: hypothetical protein LBR19_02220 [Bifidobacteriaceae bacterium]|jgi:hypothetical protein|nr:hypothetical protein [Bifidobacteriaceae bacterium]